MVKVLLLEIETHVIDRLRHSLKDYDLDWSIETADSHAEVAAHLAATPFDAVVADMHSERIDCLGVLDLIRKSTPNIIRVVLSGNPGQGALMRGMQNAHHVVAKPCSVDGLIALIQGSLTLRGTLADQRLRDLVSAITYLPVLPSIYIEMTAMLSSENSTVRDIGNVVGQDVGLSAKVLQVVNSAYFGLRRHVATPGEAAVVVGTNILRYLVLGTRVYSTQVFPRISSAVLSELCDHSFTVAALARRIAAGFKLPTREVDHAFLAGVLHEVGKLVLMQHDPVGFEKMLHTSRIERLPDTVIEQRVFGASHDLIGGYLLGTWDLPDATVEAVVYHHRPAESGNYGIAPLTAVHIADYVADPPACCRLNEDYLRALDLPTDGACWRQEYDVVAVA